MNRILFTRASAQKKRFSPIDPLILAGIAAVIYMGIALAQEAPRAAEVREISLDPWMLPWYTALSLARLSGAYLLSLVFSLFYGRLAAENPKADFVLLPTLDILQSVPILSFLPVAVLGLAAVLPKGVAVELASIVLIFTCQAWNIAYAWRQSLVSTPVDLMEASKSLRFSTWRRFKLLHFPFALSGLVWNSMVSWANGWFFLMAAEIFTVGMEEFRLPGLGAWLQQASTKGDLGAVILGLGVMGAVIVVLDQLVWRPLIAWSERFKLTVVETEDPAQSWFLDALGRSRLAEILTDRLLGPLFAPFDRLLERTLKDKPESGAPKPVQGLLFWGILCAAGAGCLYGTWKAVLLLTEVSAAQWIDMSVGLGATFLRVFAALVLAAAFSLPLGVAIGVNPKAAKFLQPIVQLTASIPATAVFPVFLLFLVRAAGGLNLAAILLMLLGSQWYLLFNVIAGASAIPEELKQTAKSLGFSTWTKWKILYLPAVFPHLVTGSVVAVGGSWNACVVSEYVNFGGETLTTVGVGAVIAGATTAGDWPLLLASTMLLVFTVVLVNRLVWKPLLTLAEEKFRLE